MRAYQKAKCCIDHQFYVACYWSHRRTRSLTLGSRSSQCSILHHLRTPTHTWFKARGIKKREKRTKALVGILGFRRLVLLNSQIQALTFPYSGFSFHRKSGAQRYHSQLSNSRARRRFLRNDKSSWDAQGYHAQWKLKGEDQV